MNTLLDNRGVAKKQCLLKGTEVTQISTGKKWTICGFTYDEKKYIGKDSTGVYFTEIEKNDIWVK